MLPPGVSILRYGTHLYLRHAQERNKLRELITVLHPPNHADIRDDPDYSIKRSSAAKADMAVPVLWSTGKAIAKESRKFVRLEVEDIIASPGHSFSG